ncbi:MAG: AtpZ/AtpI family protein [Nevskia sp.]|nr:AtpZ/AtpI family protein [Nevskia sp.]
MNMEQRDDDVVTGVRRRRDRHERWLRTGAPTLAGQLARVGVLGWIIVTPTLLGAWLGRYLDRVADSGIFWTGALIAGGVALGCWSAWKWVHS